MNYHLIDLDTWPRREHYEYYTKEIITSNAVTLRLDVTDLLEYKRRTGRHFYACFVWAVSCCVNSMESMKMMRDVQGRPGVFDTVHPVYTVFHKDSETFSDLWCHHHEDLDEFYADFQGVIDAYGHRPSLKPRPDQPANFFCISCAPWLDYTSAASSHHGEPPFFPIIVYGKYKKESDRYTLPFSISISHAAADGYHFSVLMERLQEKLYRFSKL